MGSTGQKSDRLTGDVAIRRKFDTDLWVESQVGYANE